MAESPSAHALQLHPDDHVAVTIREVSAGEAVPYGVGTVVAGCDIGPGHKIAVASVKKGDPVRRYGQIIGIATCDIAVGDHVHLHNLGFTAERGAYEFGTDVRPLPEPNPADPSHFMGYLRPDGRVGTRNFVALIATVNCSSSAVRAIVEEARQTLLPRYPNVDGIIGLTHKNGCGAPFGGPDYRQLQRTLAGYADHPNVAEAVFVGLGCEGNQPATLIDDTGLLQITRGSAPAIISLQQSGGIANAVRDAMRTLEPVLQRANEAVRTEQPVKHLKVALQCGGSDGNSGITANPALGNAVDRLASRGGTGILGETPEVFGAEHLLTRRAVSEEIGRTLLERIDWWNWYTGLWDANMDANPAPGNKEGGLTTILEKSLGAVAKGGSTPLRGVYQYAERVDESGFVFMDTPGYDPCSVTGQIAGGANLVVFTTGRGSCFGSVPAPTIKVATNTPMYERMVSDMDINAGQILHGTPLEDIGQEIYKAIVSVASGETTKSEAQGVGEEEFSPWILGPIM